MLIGRLLVTKQDHANGKSDPDVLRETLFGNFTGDADKLRSIATTHCNR
jgi:hypothetical protein